MFIYCIYASKKCCNGRMGPWSKKQRIRCQEESYCLLQEHIAPRQLVRPPVTVWLSCQPIKNRSQEKWTVQWILSASFSFKCSSTTKVNFFIRTALCEFRRSWLHTLCSCSPTASTEMVCEYASTKRITYKTAQIWIRIQLTLRSPSTWADTPRAPSPPAGPEPSPPHIPPPPPQPPPLGSGSTALHSTAVLFIHLFVLYIHLFFPLFTLGALSLFVSLPSSHPRSLALCLSLSLSLKNIQWARAGGGVLLTEVLALMS